MPNTIVSTNLIPDNTNVQKNLGSATAQWNVYGTAPTPESTSNDNTIATTAFVKNVAPTPLSFSVTLSPSGWNNLIQTITDTNFIVNGYTYIVSSSSNNIIEYSQAVVYADDVTTTGEMTFHCQIKPSVNLIVNIIRLGTN